MKIKNLILFILIMLFAVPAGAQIVNVRIYEKAGDGTRTPMSGVEVWSFIGKADANKALKKYNDEGLTLGPSDGVRDHQTSAGQTMQLRGQKEGFLILSDGLDEAILISCKQYGKEGPDGFVVEYTFVRKAKPAKASVTDESGKDLEELNVVGKVSISAEENTGEIIACGKTLSYSKKMTLPKELTRSDARYVVVPYIVELGTDSAYELTPAVLDGIDYHNTMYRRMGYDANEENVHVYDKLGKYVQQNHYMQTRVEDSLTVRGVFHGIDENKNYLIMGDIWMEDYNEVIFKDRVVINDGKFRHPQRYLDWKSSIPEVEIDYKKDAYKRTELLVEDKFSDTLQLTFEVGKSKLNMADSITNADLDKIIEKLSRIASDPESQLRSITVKGYSSPEGSFATNKTLSHARAAEIVSILNGRVRGNKPKINAEFDANDNIVTWEVVADYLENMSSSEEAQKYAKEVREICAANAGNMDKQYQAIRTNRERYDFISTNVLPHMRYVNVEYSSLQYRIIPEDETYQRYKNGESGYWDGTYLKPYQIYQLMVRLDRIGDWNGLERIAKAALESTNEELRETVKRSTIDRQHPVLAEGDTIAAIRKFRDENDRNSYVNNKRYQIVGDSLFRIYHKGDTLRYNLKDSKDYQRPYSLAAFYYTKCLLHRGVSNTKLLQDYIDDSAGGLENQKRNAGRLREWWNDEAIVLNQVKMYCLEEDYTKAFEVANKHLKAGDPRFQSFRMMLRALNCEWKSPEVIEGVASTSDMNACTVYIAQNEPEYFKKANELLKDTTKFDMSDPRVHYLRAICRFNAEEPTCQSLNQKFYQGVNVYDADAIPGGRSMNWAAPMLDAFRLDPKNLDYITNDGYFNDAYRGLVKYFWKRMQDGEPMEKIVEEYDALKIKYLKELAK